MKLSPNLSIDSIDYACQGNAILGIRESGKSYTATFIAERLMDDGIPFIAFDPIGVWRYLQKGVSGPGYPVVVAGDKGDLPLTAQSAPDIVRAAMKENVSLVVDLYSIHLSKKDWRHIVEESIRILQYENKEHGLRHIFIEEAAEFVPQSVPPEYGRVYAEIEKLSRMGGNASLGYTLINQRGEQINKAVLENCDCLILHRQKGRNSLTALKKWLDITAVESGPEIIKSLPSLDKGECWVWGEGSHVPVRVKIPEKKTVHPNRKKPHLTPAGISLDVSSFVSKMGAYLMQQPDAEKPTPAKPVTDQTKFYLDQLANNAIEIRRLNDLLLEKEERIGALVTVIKGADDFFKRIAQWIPEGSLMPAEADMIPARAQQVDMVVTAKPMAESLAPSNGISGKLPSGELKVLTACAQYTNGLTREQITVITGYKLRTRNSYLQNLSAKGCVETEGGRFRATKYGWAMLGQDFKPLPKGKALREYWIATLPKGESAILGILIDHFPKGLSRQEISEKTGYTLRTRNSYLQAMAAKEIVKVKNNGEVVASQNLFNQ